MRTHMSIISIFLTVILPVIVVSASLSKGGTLTLNRCGEYDEYQQWSQDDGMLVLSAFAYSTVSDDTESVKPSIIGGTNPTSIDEEKSTPSDAVNACLQCSARGYCHNGFKPVIQNNCNLNKTIQQFTFEPIDDGDKSIINIKISSDSYDLCLQNIGIEEYAPIQTLECNIGYDNDELQQYYYESHTGYIKSAINQNLCITAAYYPLKTCSDAPFNEYPYCNPTLDIDSRVNDLIQRMTLYEKIANLAGRGSIGVPRLGIPQNILLECLHGIVTACGDIYNGNTGCPTSFPNPLLLGASFNRTLWNKIGIAISDEGRALNNQGHGGLFCFSPNINLFRDPRWGRGQETPGEDPYLNAQYGIQYINGLQYGVELNPKYLKMSTTVKHFADYDVEGCRYGIQCRTNFTAIVSKQDQVEYYFPAWFDTIKSVKPQSIMCSYNAINGVPACGKHQFINQIARNLWNFDGFVMSDAAAITDSAFTTYVKQRSKHGIDDPLLRIKLSLEAGCDTDLGDAFYTQYMQRAVTTNIIHISSVNEAVKRWIKPAFKLGEMDHPGPDYKYYGKQYVDSPENRALALNAAQQGIVLLKNEANILPLSRDISETYGFIGPHYNITDGMLSNYRGVNYLVYQHSPLQVGIKQGLNIQYAIGCNVICNSKSGFQDAINVAKSVDTVIMFLGLFSIDIPANPDHDYTQSMEAEGFDREDITFPGYQLDLLQEIYAVNPNVVLVMFNCAQIDLSWPKANIPAIITAFYPGELGGDALISILYGDYSPAAKLPYTLYDASLVNNRDISDMSLSNNGGITYRYYKHTPVYPFGFGLSYTTFSYDVYGDDDIYLSVPMFNRVNYVIQITNTGDMDSDNVVLGFVTSDNRNPHSPKIKLFDFKRVYVERGESVKVTLTITDESILLTNEIGQQMIVPGIYKLLIGDYQNNNYVTKQITLVGRSKILFDYSPYLDSPDEDDHKDSKHSKNSKYQSISKPYSAHIHHDALATETSESFVNEAENGFILTYFVLPALGLVITVYIAKIFQLLSNQKQQPV